MLRALVTYTADERRATLAGVNLFFSALLGANLGSLNELSLFEYVRYVLLLAGAVTAVLTIGVARRRSTVFSTALAFGAVLTAILVVPDIVGDDFKRMAATLIIWLAMLLTVRITPSADDASEPPSIDDEDAVVPPARPLSRGDA